MMSDQARWQIDPPGKRADDVIDALTDRVRQLEDRVRWIEAQVAVERVRRSKEADHG
jgi:hypothetical protein